MGAALCGQHSCFNSGDSFRFSLSRLVVYRAFGLDNGSLCAFFCVCIARALAEKSVFVFDICDNLLCGAANSLCSVVDLVPGQPLGVLYFADGVFLPGGFADVLAMAAAYQRSGGQYWRKLEYTGVFGFATNVVVYAATLSWVVLFPYDPVPWLAVLLTEFGLVVVEYATLVWIVILLGKQQTARAEEAQRKLLESQLAAERVYVEQARAHRNDIRHYMVAISGYIEQEDLAGARAYLAEHQALLDNVSTARVYDAEHFIISQTKRQLQKLLLRARQEP